MKFIEEPKTCPCCSYPLEKVNDQLFCRNTACPAQTNKKLEHFCKVMGIKGLGPKTIEKLAVQDIVEIYYLDGDVLSSMLGEKIATKLLNEIEASKKASIATILESFSIPLIGGTAANKIATVLGSLSIDEIDETICKQAGLGEKATNNLITWITSEFKDIKEFLPFKFNNIIKTSTILPKVCITGKLNSYKRKEDVRPILEAHGYQLVDNLTKDVSFLINEGGDTSSKVDKAIKYNIPIICNIEEILRDNYE